MSNETWQAVAADVELRALVREVAIHASLLWDGFVFGRESDELYRIWGQGGIELHFQMANLALADVRLCDALFTASEASFPGVYTYEVTEALGQMVASHLVSTGDFPTEQEWQTAQGELALGFFERGHFTDQEMETLRAVVATQLPHWQAPATDDHGTISALGSNLIPISPPPTGRYQQPTA